MSELEKKIYKYLVNHYFGLTGMHIKPINEAHDLAEISERDYRENNCAGCDIYEIYNELQKENKDLSEMNQILADSRLKILGENQELKKRHEELIFILAEKDKQIRLMKDVIKILEHDVRFWKDKSRGLVIPITKEKIVGKLNEYAKFYVNHTNEVIMDRREFDQIASEIIGEQKIDSYNKEGNIIGGDDNEK